MDAREIALSQARDELERLRARIAELEAAARWVPVEEGLPTDERTSCTVTMALYGSRRVIHDCYYTSEAGWVDEDSEQIEWIGSLCSAIVIAWRPEPQPYGGPA